MDWTCPVKSSRGKKANSASVASDQSCLLLDFALLPRCVEVTIHVGLQVEPVADLAVGKSNTTEGDKQQILAVTPDSNSQLECDKALP